MRTDHINGESWDAAKVNSLAGELNTAQSTASSAVSGLSSKANTSHAHAQADITSLTASLSGKADVGHTHAGITGTYNTITALKAATVADSLVRVAGYYAAGDGGGGAFRWDSTDTTSADNGGTIITPTSALSSSGRWKRVYEGEVNTRWFGVNPSQSDNTAALQKAVTWVCGQPMGGVVFTPAGLYDFAFSGLSTITVNADNVLNRGEGKATRFRVIGHARPAQVDYFFTFTTANRGQGGGVKDLCFFGNSMLKWCIYLSTWRDAEFTNISTFDIHGGVLDAVASHASFFGEHIKIYGLDTASTAGTCLTQYGVRFRTSGTIPTWTDCSVRDCMFVMCWDTGVLLDACYRCDVSNIQACWSSTSSDTIDGTSKTGCLHAIVITNGIDKSDATGYHVIDGVYLESVSGSETFANNNAVYVHELTGINAQIRWNRIGNVVVNTGTNAGLLRLADDTGAGRVNNNVFIGNRQAVTGGIVIGAAVDQTDLYLTPDDGRDWSALISDAGTNTRVNGGPPTGTAATVLRPPPAAYDSFTAANSAVPDTGRWTRTVGSGTGASVDIQGNALQIKTGATGGGNANDIVALTSTLGTTLVDAEIEFCLISSAVTVESFLITALRSANVIPFNGASAYYLYLSQNASGSLQTLVAKLVASSQTILYTGPGIVQTAGQKTWYRLRVKGTSLTMWTWADGAAIPTTPTWTGTDSGVTGGGYATFALHGGTAAASGIQKLDNVAVYAL